MKKRIVTFVLIPVVVAAVFSVLNFFAFFETGEFRIYDLLLHVKPAIKEDPSILLLEIDDDAIANVGVWPWSRDIMANGLVTMSEFDAGRVVLDIEYVDNSPLGVDSRVLRKEIPQAFNEDFSQIKQSVTDLFAALSAGRISLGDAQSYIEDLAGLTEKTKQELLARVQDIARDNDTYLGHAARLNGSVNFTVNMLDAPDPAVSDELAAYAKEHYAITNVDNQVPGDFYALAAGIRPTILPILRNGTGAGFPNVIIDPDGVRRRIDLIQKYDGAYFGQLAFSPVLDILGRPTVEIHNDRIVLQGATLGDGKTQDISIPLASDHRMLINWPRTTFEGSFRHLSYWQLVLNDRLESSLVDNLRIMKDAGYLNYYQGDVDPLQAYDYAVQVKDGILTGDDPGGMEQYRDVKKAFIDATDALLGGNTEDQIIGDVKSALASPDLPDDLRAEYAPLLDEVPKTFAATRDVFAKLQKSRSILSDALEGSLVFVGFTGTGTTDIGVNPFEERYMNVGTHAAVANTIFQQKFLDKLPAWYSIALAFILALLVAALIRNMAPLPSMIVGFISALVFIAAGVGFFITTGVYLPLLTPTLAIFFTFLAITAMKFLQTAQERSYIRNAFSHYLSADVINDLLSDPSKLALGGEKKYLTAFFTDVKGFSTISEKLDPSELVKLLNSYLTEMSNIILELHGTIDKYEGDAIISFFGAPIDFADHAERGCLAAVRMKKMEQILNEHVMEEGLSPGPLHTRIGINTGDMVVGNMGTAQKMDYTMMGNSVNLAARLEGVNKQYGTWILVSETTQQEAGERFAFRRLDQVRVVGINTAVRLFELVDEKSALDPTMAETLEAFHQAFDAFEEREWERARAGFERVLKIHPEDGPAQTYLKRSKDFLKKAPPANWDGVYNLTMK